MACPGLASDLRGLRALVSLHWPHPSVSRDGSGTHSILTVPWFSFLISSGPTSRFQEVTATMLGASKPMKWDQAYLVTLLWPELRSARDYNCIARGQWGPCPHWCLPSSKALLGPDLWVERLSEACRMLRGHAFLQQAPLEPDSPQWVPLMPSSFDGTHPLSWCGKVSQKVLTFLLVWIINFLNRLLNQMTLKKKSSPPLPFLKFILNVVCPDIFSSFALCLFFPD